MVKAGVVWKIIQDIVVISSERKDVQMELNKMKIIRKGKDMRARVKSPKECGYFGSGWCCNKGTTGHCCNK